MLFGQVDILVYLLLIERFSLMQFTLLKLIAAVDYFSVTIFVLIFLSFFSGRETFLFCSWNIHEKDVKNGSDQRLCWQKQVYKEGVHLPKQHWLCMVAKWNSCSNMWLCQLYNHKQLQKHKTLLNDNELKKD